MRNGRPGEESVAEAPSQVTTRLSTRPIRLPVLLVCSGIIIAALGGGCNSVLSTEGGGSIASAGSCVPTLPPLLSVPWSNLVKLRASLLPMMAPLARSRYAWGTVRPRDAWSDAPPQSPFSSRQANGLWPGSYEMRSWTSASRLASKQANVVADVFLFADSGQAGRFFAQASSSRCHRAGKDRPVSRPPQARNLIWVNPDGPTQEDVFMLRGRKVYRVGAVWVQTPSDRPAANAEQQARASKLDALACALPAAHC
jgi:hypothetical protein